MSACRGWNAPLHIASRLAVWCCSVSVICHSRTLSRQAYARLAAVYLQQGDYVAALGAYDLVGYHPQRPQCPFPLASLRAYPALLCVGATNCAHLAGTAHAAYHVVALHQASLIMPTAMFLPMHSGFQIFQQPNGARQPVFMPPGSCRTAACGDQVSQHCGGHGHGCEVTTQGDSRLLPSSWLARPPCGTGTYRTHS